VANRLIASTSWSPSVTWLIRLHLILHWIDKLPKKNIFQSIFQKVHKNYPSIGWSCIFFGVSCDGWPQASLADAANVYVFLYYVIRFICNTFLYLHGYHDLGVTDTYCHLFVHHLLRRWYTAFAHVILNFSILYLWIYRIFWLISRFSGPTFATQFSEVGSLGRYSFEPKKQRSKLVTKTCITGN